MPAEQDPTQAMTATYLKKIDPEPVVSREQELDAENASLNRQLSEANAKILNLQADLELALDALREMGSAATYTVQAIAGARVNGVSLVGRVLQEGPRSRQAEGAGQGFQRRHVDALQEAGFGQRVGRGQGDACPFRELFPVLDPVGRHPTGDLGVVPDNHELEGRQKLPLVQGYRLDYNSVIIKRSPTP